MNKNSLITSDKIYYKLLWHENADTKKDTITFLNLGKLKTISFHDWIPMEKVVKFLGIEFINFIIKMKFYGIEMKEL